MSAGEGLRGWLDRALALATPGLGRDEVGLRLERLEARVRAAPERAFEVDPDGRATLRGADGERWAAGRFETPTLGELERRLAGRPSGPVTLHVLVGAAPMADVAALQAAAEPGTLFQVASQFNCLEAPGLAVVPVASYVDDATQGPRAAVSAFPGTFLRHYRAPDGSGGWFSQGEREIELLGDALDAGLARVSHGYLLVEGVPDPGRARAALAARFDHVRVGLHEGVQVALGHAWGGPVPGDVRIAQVFTAAMALSYGAPPSPEHLALARELLCAGQYGTLLGAAALGSRRAVLTLVGGGVFGNPVRDVWRAILWALDRYQARGAPPLEVVLNGFHLAERVPPEELLAEARARGGALVRCEPGGYRLER